MRIPNVKMRSMRQSEQLAETNRAVLSISIVWHVNRMRIRIIESYRLHEDTSAHTKGLHLLREQKEIESQFGTHTHT